MGKFEQQGGIAFLLIYYSVKNIVYYMRYEEMFMFWKRAENGGRKSFRFDELNEKFFFELKQGVFVPYLDMINKDLDMREK